MRDWAAVAEILGTAGLIVSLIFVAHSINLNTKAVRASHDNFIYEIQNSRDLVATGDGELSSILHRAFEGGELTELEEFRFLVFQGTFIDL